VYDRWKNFEEKLSCFDKTGCDRQMDRRYDTTEEFNVDSKAEYLA